MKILLTVAGFDPSSGAGITADLMVFAAHGLFGTSCITALTVQSTLGVRSMYPVSEEIVRETLECLDADLKPAGIKIGMVGNSLNLFRICDYIKAVKVNDSDPRGTSNMPVVLDPVVRSSSGRELLDHVGLTALREQMIPLVDWITPNVEELSALLGEPVVPPSDVPDACRALQADVARVGNRVRRLGIVTTGGDSDPPDDFLLTPAGEEIWLAGERVATRSTHGTGCAFSSAFLSRLVLGDQPEVAARMAKAYVAGALTAANRIGGGYGPVNHLWPLLQANDELK